MIKYEIEPDHGDKFLVTKSVSPQMSEVVFRGTHTECENFITEVNENVNRNPDKANS